MTEYVVKWKHWRCAHEFDALVRWAKCGSMSVDYATRDMATWFQPSNVSRPAGHGGKTQCVIWEVGDVSGTSTLTTVASAETVCSWRDQFDRRVGRLYSLALALCDWDAPIEDRYHIFCNHAGHYSDSAAWDMYDALDTYDRGCVKRICSEIMQSWRTPPHRERTKPTAEQIEQWRAEKHAQEAVK